MPTPRSSGGSAVTSSPPKKIRPAVGVSSPQIMFSVVDLPQPEGPSSPTSLPSGTSKVRSRTAVTAPRAFLPRAGNCLVRSCNWIFMPHIPPFFMDTWYIIQGFAAVHKFFCSSRPAGGALY